MIHLNFREQYVAYLDVLGFKEMVNNNDKEKLLTYFKTVSKAVKDVQKDKEKLKLFLISDSIIIIADNDIEEFKLLLRAIQTIQIRLINENIWLRGAVSFGEVDYDIATNLIVGKALSKAYLLEKEASLPHVILDPAILSFLKMDKKNFTNLLNGNLNIIEEQGTKLINDRYNYISEESIFVAFGNRFLFEYFYEQTQSLQKVYEYLLSNLYSEHKNYPKYLWLKKYFVNCLSEYYSADIKEKKKRKSGIDDDTIGEWLGKFDDL